MSRAEFLLTSVVMPVNVPINHRTAAWQMSDAGADWHRMRTQWHFFQGIRGGLFAVAFLLLAIATLN